MPGWLIGFLSGSFLWMPVGFLLAAMLSANGEEPSEMPTESDAPKPIPDNTVPSE